MITATYSISGKVLDAQNNPVPGGVTVFTDNGLSTTTNSDGSYSLNGLSASDYIITALKDGYTFVPPTQSLSLMGDVMNINFTATPVSPLTYSILGQIVDASGKGLVGVVVSDDKGDRTVTNSKGFYKLNSLLVGSYTITPAKKNYFFNPSLQIVIVATNVTAVNFTATHTYNISGRVATAKNKPIADATLSYGVGLTTTTDTNGKYVINNIVDDITRSLLQK